MLKQLLTPDWPVVKNIRAYSTTRAGGNSHKPYDSFNLGCHVGDSEQAVSDNRHYLQTLCHLPSEPIWLQQLHTNVVINATHQTRKTVADAAYTTAKNIVCVVLTADCLPVLLCDRQASCVAAVHAGWRGIHAGIIETSLAAMPVNNNEIYAWLGPAIGPNVYEVGDEVREQFIEKDKQHQSAFVPSPTGQWLANLAELAKQELAKMGVQHVYGGQFCTYSDPQRFYSYRRDGATGRMASLIWISE